MHVNMGGIQIVLQATLTAILFCWSAIGCQHAAPQTPPKAAPEHDYTQTIAALQLDNDALRQSLTASEKKSRRLQQEISDLKIQAIEQTALVNELRRISEGQQKSLDAAIVDVVRSKAKLRSLESKAEAASTLAEAEIAYKALQSRASSADWMALDEVAIAEHLLEMSSQEFDAQNYGGALYLANQTKARVRAAQNRLSTIANIELLPGEALFAQPVPLKLLKNSNLRSGPGLTHEILSELQRDTMVLGFAHKGEWVHVEAAAGVTGWIFRALVSSQ